MGQMQSFWILKQAELQDVDVGPTTQRTYYCWAARCRADDIVAAWRLMMPLDLQCWVWRRNVLWRWDFMKTVAECYKNPEFREHRIKNYTVVGTGGKALGTVAGHWPSIRARSMNLCHRYSPGSEVVGLT